MKHNMNPELLRNLWLEMTPHRLIAMPLILAALFFVIYLIAQQSAIPVIKSVSMLMYFLLALFWGTRLAGESIINEIRDYTWDTQRMTAITPWTMTWGKLFGSTVYAWYGAIICLLVYAAVSTAEFGAGILKIVIACLLAGVLTQSIAMLSSMFAMERKYTRKRTTSVVFLVVGAALLVPALKFAFSDAPLTELAIQWYGMSPMSLDFALFSLLVFCFWSILGLYRKMRAELQYRNRPFVWLAFNVFCAAYLAGFVGQQDFSVDAVYTVRLFVAFFTVLILTYAALLIETKNPLVFRRLLLSARVQHWPTVLQNTNAWLANLPLLLLLLILISSLNFGDVKGVVFDYFGKSLAVSLMVFLLRDIALFIFFNLGEKARRADITVIVYLVALYWLLPTMLAGVQVPWLASMFMPYVQTYPVVTIVAGIVQLGFLAAMVRQRWLRNFPRETATAAS